MISLRSHFLLVLFIAGVIGLFAFYFNPAITGFATLEPKVPKLNLTLTETDFLSNQSIEGILRINISGPIDEKTEFIAKINNNIIKKRTIIDIIAKSLNISIPSAHKTISKIIYSNPESKKDITLEKDKPILIGFVVPQDGEIISIDMKVNGSKVGSSYPSELSMDFDLDGNPDWVYIGYPTTPSNKILPSEITSIEDKAYLKSFNYEGSYRCRAIEIPLSKKFTIYTKYKKIEQGGDIRAALFRCDNPNCDLSYPEASCDLILESQEFKEESCTLEIAKPIQGVHLGCVYTVTGADDKQYYQINLADKSGGLVCPDDSNDTITCNPGPNPNIRIEAWDHNKQINESTNINFSKWITLTELDPLTDVIDDLLSNYIYPNDIYTYPGASLSSEHCIEVNEYQSECVLPLALISKTPGIINLSDLNLDYEGAVTSTFYDIKILPPLIHTINQTNLSKDELILEIPLSSFNLRTPSTNLANETFNLVIETSTGHKISKQFTVFSTQTPDQTSLTYQIEDSKSRLEALISNPDVMDVIDFFNFDLTTPLTLLTEYGLQLKEINQSNKTQTEKEELLNSIKNNVTKITSEIPLISIDKKISPIEILTSPSDITSEVSSKDRTKLHLYQQNARIELESKVVIIEENSTSSTKTLIKKIIDPKIRLSNIDIIEVIPKAIASSASKIEFKSDNYEILRSDPIVKFHFDSLGSETTITYAVPGDVLSSTQDINTFLVPETFPEEPISRASVCGDGVCTLILEDKISCPEDCKVEIPWAFIIILLILMILGIIIIIMYHKGYIKKIIQGTKKPKFKSSKDIDNLVKYVQTAKKQGFKKQQINDALLKKGWTQSQIDYIFKIEKKRTSKKPKKQKTPKTPSLGTPKKEKKGFFSRLIKVNKKEKKPKKQEEEIFPFLPPQDMNS